MGAEKGQKLRYFNLPPKHECALLMKLLTGETTDQCPRKWLRWLRILTDKSKSCGQFWPETTRKTNGQTANGQFIAFHSWTNVNSMDTFHTIDTLPYHGHLSIPWTSVNGMDNCPWTSVHGQVYMAWTIVHSADNCPWTCVHAMDNCPWTSVSDTVSLVWILVNELYKNTTFCRELLL